MKKKLISNLFLIMAILLGTLINNNAIAGNGNISFYKVPLVCPAATHIGCGSKSKPVLLGFEKRDNIVSEAWLNRSGTLIAIVWKENSTTEIRTKVADSVFLENKLEVILCSGKEEKNLIKEFKKKENWYRGNDVDKLSMEEAGVIADRLINRVHTKTPLSKEQTDSLKIGFVQVFTNRFTKNYGSQINNNEQQTVEDNKKVIEEDLLVVGKKYLDENQLAELKNAIALGLRPTESESKQTDNCCSSKSQEKNRDSKKTETKGCCSKPKN